MEKCNSSCRCGRESHDQVETVKTGWRKITRADMVCGTVIRMTQMSGDGAYNMATIVNVSRMDDETWPHIRVARPYAYAHDGFNSNDALLGAECFDLGVERTLSAASDVEVFQGTKAVRSMVT